MQDYKKLSVWSKSHQLVLHVYEATANISDKRYPGLASQIRRSAASVPANIVEGCGHTGSKQLAKFLGIAVASSFELGYHLQLASDLSVISKSDFARLDARTEQVRRMLSALLAKVRQANGKP